jgi:hypothetical protein
MNFIIPGLVLVLAWIAINHRAIFSSENKNKSGDKLKAGKIVESCVNGLKDLASSYVPRFLSDPELYNYILLINSYYINDSLLARMLSHIRDVHIENGKLTGDTECFKMVDDHISKKLEEFKEKNNGEDIFSYNSWQMKPAAIELPVTILNASDAAKLVYLTQGDGAIDLLCDLRMPPSGKPYPEINEFTHSLVRFYNAYDNVYPVVGSGSTSEAKQDLVPIRKILESCASILNNTDFKKFYMTDREELPDQIRSLFNDMTSKVDELAEGMSVSMPDLLSDDDKVESVVEQARQIAGLNGNKVSSQTQTDSSSGQASLKSLFDEDLWDTGSSILSSIDETNPDEDSDDDDESLLSESGRSSV